MFRSRYLWKLYASYAFLILLTIAVVGALVAGRIEKDAMVEIDRRLESQTRLLRELAVGDLARGSELRHLQEKVHSLGREVGTRFTVIDASGVVLADSDQEPARMDNHRDRPELEAARREGIGTASRYSRTLQRSMRYLALPYEAAGDGADISGFVRAALPLTQVSGRLNQLRLLVALGGALAALVALLLGFFLARRFIQPLLSMTTAAESIAAGSYDQEVRIRSDDELGKLAGAFNTMSGRLRESLATLHADRGKLSAILASMAEGVVAVDRQEKVVHLNRAAGRLLRVEGNTALGRPVWEVTRIRQISEVLAESIRRDEAIQQVARIPGVSEQLIELHAAPLRSEDGELAGAVLLIDDVTQLRRLENMRQDFVGNVSHELKTPVTVIRGLVETMREDPELPPAMRERFLAKVADQTLRMSSIVTDLLSLSRLESEVDPELEPLELEDPVEDACAALQPSIDAKSLTLELTQPKDSLMVQGEHEMLREAVGNLIGNAVKYSPRGGTIHIRLLQKGKRAVVEVQDHGIGIEPRFQERIFERFFRVDKARSRELGGTGLGLAIVKHTAHRLGGTISLTSQPGAGSTFRLELPLV